MIGTNHIRHSSKQKLSMWHTCKFFTCWLVAPLEAFSWDCKDIRDAITEDCNVVVRASVSLLLFSYFHAYNILKTFILIKHILKLKENNNYWICWNCWKVSFNGLVYNRPGSIFWFIDLTSKIKTMNKRGTIILKK